MHTSFTIVIIDNCTAMLRQLADKHFTVPFVHAVNCVRDKLNEI
jgi:hypothetical protein